MSQNQPLQLRIFLSSPGDVQNEREIALKLFEQIQYDPELRGKVTIEAIAWDKPGSDTPLLASMTPQEAINRGLPQPSECDIVVVIFWARMGTPLPPDYTQADGSRFLSGTQWEYQNALDASKDDGTPLVAVYRRSEEPVIGLKDPQRADKIEQWERVEAFFGTFTNPDGSIKQGFNTYSSPDDFRVKFETHLKKMVREFLDSSTNRARLKRVPRGGSAAVKSDISAVLWEGSPFPGLRSFTPLDAPIYFGRGAETDALVNLLSDSDNRLVMVVGASGSGKSSLVGAGLLPRLAANAVEGSKDWLLPAYDASQGRWTGLRFTPGEMGDNPFLPLARQLAAMTNDTAQNVASKLASDPGSITSLIHRMLLGKPPWSQVVCFIDQFEELFTLVHERYLDTFVDLMISLTAPTSRARVIGTLRADFYVRCLEHAWMAELLKTSTYPLAAPSPGALAEMITHPAERAGLQFEDRLVDRILRDTGTDPGGLALMAFALDALVHASTDKHLTNTEYEKVGGVQHAIGQRAEAVFQTVDAEAQAELPNILREICEVDERGVASGRRASLNRAARTKAARRLVNALTETRLLVTDAAGSATRAAMFGAAARDDAEAQETAHDLSADLGVPLAQPISAQDDKATVEVAHEALLRNWERAARWIDSAQDDLRLIRQIRQGADDWRRSNYDAGYLLSGIRLEQARPWLSGGVLTAMQQEYVSASAHADDKRREAENKIARRVQMLSRVRNGLIAAAVIAVGVIFWAGVSLSNAQQGQREAETVRDQLAAEVADITGQLGDLQVTATANQGVIDDANATLTQIPETLEAAQATVQQVGTIAGEFEAVLQAVTPIPITLTAMGGELRTAEAQATSYALAALDSTLLSPDQLATADAVRVALLLLTPSATFTQGPTPTNFAADATETISNFGNLLTPSGPTPGPLQLTATEIISRATQTARAGTPGTATLDGFILTATEIIARATQTAQANRTASTMVNPLQTSTALALNETQTAQAVTPTTTPTPDRTLAAIAKDVDAYVTRTYAPINGTLEHEAEDTFVTVYEADARLADFVVDVRFFNPYDRGENDWDYGIFFRDVQSQQYRVALTSEGYWSHEYVAGGVFTTLNSGFITSSIMDTSEDGHNDLRLVVRGRGAQFYVNDNFVAELDVSAHWKAGTIQVVTGSYQGNEVTGRSTAFENLIIREIEGVPVPTPTTSATPEAVGEATIGDNLGKTEFAGGQFWTYNGKADEILRISVVADRPARTSEDEDRDSLGFDTLVNVYAPDGRRIAEDDDIEDGVITNSLIERVRLPEDGVYRIEVRSWADESGGAYTLTIESIE